MSHTDGQQRFFLDVSAGAFEEIKARFEACGATERIVKVEGREEGSLAEGLDLGGIYLRSEQDERVGVWLVFNGKRLNPPPKAPLMEPVQPGEDIL